MATDSDPVNPFEPGISRPNIAVLPNGFEIHDRIIERWLVDEIDVHGAGRTAEFWTDKFAPKSYPDELTARIALARKLSIAIAATRAALDENEERIQQIRDEKEASSGH